MKKLLALLLAMAMMVALVACGGNGGNNTAGNQTDDTTQNDTGNAGNDAQTDEGGEETTGGDAAAVTNADDIPDSMTSEDGKYQVAFVTDVGQLKDKSFNQGTYDGVKLYAAANGLSYKYYQPAGGNEATDDDRYEAMKAAASESFGYNEDPIVSSDVIGMRYGSLFDATQTMVSHIDGDLYEVQVVSWYDNENSYTSQMVRTIKYFAELG